MSGIMVGVDRLGLDVLDVDMDWVRLRFEFRYVSGSDVSVRV